MLDNMMKLILYGVVGAIMFFLPMGLLEIMAWLVGYTGDPENLMMIYSLIGGISSFGAVMALATTGERK